ncbi:hypothetical protein [Neobacillus cucumis]|uniref:hypothetical protein n=1 Tax=Neobacillus cucumis TaxID=1740721 RepID=UPI001964E7DC|nr:hypothetical protein [Neobacillus cucumis]MBM7652860.1 hypothetical protein [Neobacillus cucumis]MDR4946964.1 hypothetical protein [Neobacillus cucumis]MED4226407.1 hypothetical protein [Neobacillus cucumis]
MFAVHFFENKNLLLSQLLNTVPAVGEQLKIKGRKGTILGVTNVEDNKYHVQVELEKVTKGKTAVVDQSKKRKR